LEKETSGKVAWLKKSRKTLEAQGRVVGGEGEITGGKRTGGDSQKKTPKNFRISWGELGDFTVKREGAEPQTGEAGSQEKKKRRTARELMERQPSLYMVGRILLRGKSGGRGESFL